MHSCASVLFRDGEILNQVQDDRVRVQDDRVRVQDDKVRVQDDRIVMVGQAPPYLRVRRGFCVFVFVGR